MKGLFQWSLLPVVPGPVGAINGDILKLGSKVELGFVKAWFFIPEDLKTKNYRFVRDFEPVEFIRYVDTVIDVHGLSLHLVEIN